MGWGLLGLLGATCPSIASADAVPNEASRSPEPDLSPRLVDMVVAQVDETAITLSELVAETRLVLLRTQGLRVAERGSLDQPLLNAVLSAIIQRELIQREIKRLQLRELGDEDLAVGLSGVRRLLPTVEAFEHFMDVAGFQNLGPDAPRAPGSPPPLLANILRIERLVDRFVEVRIRANIVVSDAELRQCLELSQDRLDKSWKTAAPALRRTLARAKERAELGSFIRDLARRAEIRYAPSFEPERHLADFAPDEDPCEIP
ncbi:MAG: hypothetical protein IPK13_15845 [Deltaproteobacteria bacterium]|nr:hypothetical protein [Deltaproteobacteria bacterium]